MKPTFFKSQAVFRAWLEKHHADTPEVQMGFYKSASGKAGITYKQALDEALCFGWIDGVLTPIDETSYMRRFTPRRARSVWSAINLGRATELEAAGLMAAPGLAALRARDPARTAIYAYENVRDFNPEQLARFKGEKKAWPFWETQPPGYRRIATSWALSAKRESTRERRVDALIACSRRGERIPQLIPRKPTAKPTTKK